MENQTDKFYFQPGGSLPADSPTYVKRKSDDILFNYLKDGKFCYILTARQMGKSSMRVQVARRLEAEGVSCVNIDLTAIGSLDTTTEQWYYSLLNKTCRDLELPGPLLRKWWGENLDLSPVNRFSTFIEQVLLKQVKGYIVIFIDEIDSILSLDRSKFSTDDFFAVIRHCYNSRVDDPDYNRLTFALMGVATPNDLMQDPSRTPFNIGYHVDLESFDFKNSAPLLKGLKGLQAEPDDLLKSVLDWTCGQPYLTQKICHSLVSSPADITDISVVEQQVDKLFFTEEFDDHNIKNVNNRILLHETYNIQMLEIVQQLLKEKRIEADDGDFAQIYLRLSGLVKKKDNHLVIRNKIYQNIFNEQWLKNAMGKIRRPFAEAMQNWMGLEKPKSAALRGEVLEQALEWAEKREDITPTENEFLNFSQLVRQEEREKEIELLYTNRLRIRNRILVFALVIAVIAGVVAGYFAFEANRQTQNAKKQEIKANEQAERATEQAKIAKEQETIALHQKTVALNNLKKLKESLITLDQSDECRLGVIEYLYQDKDLIESLRQVPSEEQLQAHFDKLLKAVEERSAITVAEYVARFKLRTNVAEPKDYPIDVKTPSGKKLEDFKVPEELIKNDHHLINLILKTESMNDDERQYWFNLWEVMNHEQREKLRDILTRERQKLAEIGKLKEDPKVSLAKLTNRLEYLSKKISELHMFHISDEIFGVKSLWEENDFKEFEANFLNLKDKFATAHEFHFALSCLYSCQNKMTKAINHVKLSVSEKPYKIKYLERLADYYTQEKKYDDAQGMYKIIIPMLSMYLQLIDSDKTRIHYSSLLMNSAKTYMNMGKTEHAIKEYEDIRNLSEEYLSKERNENDLADYLKQIEKTYPYYDKEKKNHRIALDHRKICVIFSKKLIDIKRSEENLYKHVQNLWSASWYESHLENYEKSLNYLSDSISIIEQLLEINRSEKYLENYSMLLLNMSNDFRLYKKYDKSLQYAEKGFAIGEELQEKFKRTDRLAKAYERFSEIQLIKCQFKEAINSAQKGIEIDHEKKFIDVNEVNLAHAYLLSDRFEEAKAIYFKYKGKQNDDENQLWEKSILESFTFFRKNGLIHSKMLDIEEILDVYVEDIQSLLSELGYNPGTIDNRMGENTEIAIRAYQKDMDLKIDGKPSVELLNHLILNVYNKEKPSEEST